MANYVPPLLSAEYFNVKSVPIVCTKPIMIYFKFCEKGQLQSRNRRGSHPSQRRFETLAVRGLAVVCGACGFVRTAAIASTPLHGKSSPAGSTDSSVRSTSLTTRGERHRGNSSGPKPKEPRPTRPQQGAENRSTVFEDEKDWNDREKEAQSNSTSEREREES